MTSYQQYASDAFPSLDSLEGVPDWFEPHAKASPPNSLRGRVHEAMAWIAVMLPGFSLALLIAVIAYLISDRIGLMMNYQQGRSPISQITLAVVLGLVMRNTIGVPQAYEHGLRFCLRTVLRIGIVILGLTLSIVAVGHDALVGLPVIVGCISVAMISVTYITKSLRLPPRLGTLIAVGTSICGVSAIVATAPIIEADETETSYAVACITIFGLVAMLVYPFLAHHIFETPRQAGVFFGTAIHDMSQATGAGLAYAQQYDAEPAFKTAVTVKLVRNLFMSLMIPLAGILYHRGAEAQRRVKQRWHQIVPLFVLGFLLMACLRSIGDASGAKAFGFVNRAQWNVVGESARLAVPWFLAVAMGAVGLGTGLSKLKQLGLKPFSVGLAAALLVGMVSFGLIWALTPVLFR